MGEECINKRLQQVGEKTTLVWEKTRAGLKSEHAYYAPDLPSEGGGDNNKHARA